MRRASSGDSGFPRNFIGGNDYCVCSDEKAIGGIAQCARCRASLGQRQASDVVGTQLARTTGFIENRRMSLERNPGIAQDFGAAGRGGCQNQFHFALFTPQAPTSKTKFHRTLRQGTQGRETQRERERKYSAERQDRSTARKALDSLRDHRSGSIVL